MQRLLNTNPDVCIPPESTTLALLYDKYLNKKKWNQEVLKTFVKDVFLDDKISDWWKISKRDFRRYVLEIFPRNYHSAIFLLYKFYTKQSKPEAEFIGDKNPSNSLYIRQIIETFPNAKFIVLVRNPVDNVFSFQNVSFDSNSSKVLAHRWNFYNNEILNWSNKFPEKFHILKFEDLIENTVIELKSISSFLSLENKFDFKEVESGERAWQKNLGTEISSKHINKGENNISATEKKMINSICGKTANQIGYNIEFIPKGNFHLYSLFFNNFEKHFVRLPLYLSTSILKFYRKKKKIIVEN